MGVRQFDSFHANTEAALHAQLGQKDQLILKKEVTQGGHVWTLEKTNHPKLSKLIGAVSSFFKRGSSPDYSVQYSAGKEISKEDFELILKSLKPRTNEQSSVDLSTPTHQNSTSAQTSLSKDSPLCKLLQNWRSLSSKSGLNKGSYRSSFGIRSQALKVLDTKIAFAEKNLLKNPINQLNHLKTLHREVAAFARDNPRERAQAITILLSELASAITELSSLTPQTLGVFTQDSLKQDLALGAKLAKHAVHEGCFRVSVPSEDEEEWHEPLIKLVANSTLQFEEVVTIAKELLPQTYDQFVGSLLAQTYEKSGAFGLSEAFRQMGKQLDMVALNAAINPIIMQNIDELEMSCTSESLQLQYQTNPPLRFYMESIVCEALSNTTNIDNAAYNWLSRQDPAMDQEAISAALAHMKSSPRGSDQLRQMCASPQFQEECFPHIGESLKIPLLKVNLLDEIAKATPGSEIGRMVQWLTVIEQNHLNTIETLKESLETAPDTERADIKKSLRHLEGTGIFNLYPAFTSTLAHRMAEWSNLSASEQTRHIEAYLNETLAEEAAQVVKDLARETIRELMPRMSNLSAITEDILIQNARRNDISTSSLAADCWRALSKTTLTLPDGQKILGSETSHKNFLRLLLTHDQSLDPEMRSQILSNLPKDEFRDQNHVFDFLIYLPAQCSTREILQMTNQAMLAPLTHHMNYDFAQSFHGFAFENGANRQYDISLSRVNPPQVHISQEYQYKADPKQPHVALSIKTELTMSAASTYSPFQCDLKIAEATVSPIKQESRVNRQALISQLQDLGATIHERDDAPLHTPKLELKQIEDYLTEAGLPSLETFSKIAAGQSGVSKQAIIENLGHITKRILASSMEVEEKIDLLQGTSERLAMVEAGIHARQNQGLYSGINFMFLFTQTSPFRSDQHQKLTDEVQSQHRLLTTALQALLTSHI